MVFYKKFFIACLIIIIPAVHCAMGADYIDTIDTPLEEAVSALSTLGILEGYEDQTFRPNQPMTRAEVAVVMSKLLVAESAVSTKPSPFSDISPEDEVYSDIMLLYDTGVMDGVGDGRFEPDQNITLEQTIKIILGIMGYSSYAQSKGGYPVGYILTASELKLTANVSAAAGDDITRAMLAQIVYSALDTDVMELSSAGARLTYTSLEGRTLLTQMFKLEKISGIITANEFTSLSGDTEQSKGKIVVDGRKFSVGDTNASNFLGYYVEFFVTTERDAKIVWIKPLREKNNTLTIEAEDILDATLDKITFLNVNERITSANFSTTLRVIYNGRGINKIEASRLKPQIGNIVLLDADADGRYELATVNDWVNYVVDGINAEQKIIYVKYDKQPNGIIPDDDSVIIKNGLKVEISSLREWDVIAVMKSVDDVYTIEVSTQKIEGTISEIGNDTITLDSKSYQRAPDFNKPLNVGDIGTVCLTKDGKIAGFIPSTQAGSENYGYLFAVNADNGISDMIQMKILLADGEFKIYDLADRVTVDDVSVKRKEIIGESSLFYDAANEYNYNVSGQSITVPSPTIRQLIFFGTNSEDKITKINTAQKRLTQGIDLDNFSMDRSYNAKTDSSPNDGTGFRIVRNYIGLTHRIGGNTKIFFVPETDYRYFDGDTKHDDYYRINREDEYGAGPSTLIGTDVSYNHFELYDALEDRSVNAMVIYTMPSSATSTITVDELRREVAVVDKVTMALNSDGGLTYKLGMYQLGKAVSKMAKDTHVSNPVQSKWTKYVNKTVGDLRPGDVIQFSVNVKDEITDFLLLFRQDESVTFEENFSALNQSVVGNDPPLDRLYTLYGQVGQIFGNNITIKDDQQERHLLSIARTNFYIFNKATEAVTPCAKVDLFKGDKIFIRAYDYQLYTVVIYR